MIGFITLFVCARACVSIKVSHLYYFLPHPAVCSVEVSHAYTSMQTHSVVAVCTSMTGLPRDIDRSVNPHFKPVLEKIMRANPLLFLQRACPSQWQHSVCLSICKIATQCTF